MFPVLKSRPLLITYYLHIFVGSDGKESGCSVGGPGSVSGLGRFPGEGNGKPLQYSCLEKSMDRGAWRAIAPGIAKSGTGLSNHYTAYLTVYMLITASSSMPAKPHLFPGLLRSHFSSCLEMSSFFLFLNC